jgi:hypothetical protein
MLFPDHIFPSWGFFALASLLIINLLEIQGIESLLFSILYLPIMLNELFLAFWLLFKGFNQSTIISVFLEN